MDGRPLVCFQRENIRNGLNIIFGHLSELARRTAIICPSQSMPCSFRPRQRSAVTRSDLDRRSLFLDSTPSPRQTFFKDLTLDIPTPRDPAPCWYKDRVYSRNRTAHYEWRSLCVMVVQEQRATAARGNSSSPSEVSYLLDTA